MENITEYKRDARGYVAYYGKATFKNGFVFADGDETFYHFIGKNSCYSMLELLHPSDVEGFMDIVNHLDEGLQCGIVRMKDADDQYVVLYIECRLNGVVMGDFKSFDMEFCNFMAIKNRYTKYMALVKKYREFMSLSTKMFFEYTFATDEMNIYRYANIKSQTLLKMPLDSMRGNIDASAEFTKKQKGEFEVLYEALKKGLDRFGAEVDAGLIVSGAQGRYEIKGSTLYENNSRTMAIGLINNIDAKEEQTSYYLTDSAIDPGTGVLNKRAINEYAVEKIQEDKPLYLAIMDVDDFKRVNDSYGHMFGDEVLLKVSEIMRSVLDSRGMVGRFGGDEFMCVFDGVSSEEELRRILKTISKHIQWAYQDMKDSLTITTSVGVAKYPDDGANYEELFKRADKALYIAKAKGKNRFIIYDEKKHGSLESDTKNDRSVGIKSIVSDHKKAEVMSQVTLSLHREGACALNNAMEMLRSYFDIDGIAVFAGKNMERTLSSGRYVNPIGRLSFIENQAYLDLFDENGVYVESNIARLSNAFPDAHKLYELQETREFVQCMAFDGDKPKSVVSFEFFNRAPKLGVTDLGLMIIVGRLMAEVSCGLA